MDNLYYDTRLSVTQTGMQLRERGLDLDQRFLESIDIYPCEDVPPHVDGRLYTVAADGVEFVPLLRMYRQVYVVREKSDFEARRLEAAREDKRAAFAEVFAVLDAQKTRPAAAIAEALAAGETPDAGDAWRLSELEAVSTENRELLRLVETATTLEGVEAVEPWLPEGIREGEQQRR